MPTESICERKHELDAFLQRKKKNLTTECGLSSWVSVFVSVLVGFRCLEKLSLPSSFSLFLINPFRLSLYFLPLTASIFFHTLICLSLYLHHFYISLPYVALCLFLFVSLYIPPPYALPLSLPFVLVFKVCLSLFIQT